MKIQFKPDPKPEPKPKKEKKPLNKVSKKRGAQNVEYSALKRAYLKENPFCQKRLDGCSGIAMDIHHTKGGKDRSATFLDTSTWMGVCRSCHSLIHDKNL